MHFLYFIIIYTLFIIHLNCTGDSRKNIFNNIHVFMYLIYAFILVYRLFSSDIKGKFQWMKKNIKGMHHIYMRYNIRVAPPLFVHSMLFSFHFSCSSSVRGVSCNNWIFTHYSIFLMWHLFLIIYNIYWDIPKVTWTD